MGGSKYEFATCQVQADWVNEVDKSQEITGAGKKVFLSCPSDFSL